jgi:hypothetical protein
MIFAKVESGEIDTHLCSEKADNYIIPSDSSNIDQPLGLTRGGLSKRQYISDEGIELQTSTERIESKLLKIMSIFKYINSLLVKDT